MSDSIIKIEDEVKELLFAKSAAPHAESVKDEQSTSESVSSSLDESEYSYESESDLSSESETDSLLESESDTSSLAAAQTKNLPVVRYDSGSTEPCLKLQLATKDVDEPVVKGQENLVPRLTEKEIISLRFHSRQRLQLAFESIYKRYGRNLEAISDVIDLETETVAVDNGHLRRHKKNTVGKTWKGLEGKVVNDALMTLWRQGALKVVENVTPKDLEVHWYPSALESLSGSRQTDEGSALAAEQRLSNWSTFRRSVEESKQRLQVMASTLRKNGKLSVNGESELSGPEDGGCAASAKFVSEPNKKDLSVLQRREFDSRYNVSTCENSKRKLALSFYNDTVKHMRI